MSHVWLNPRVEFLGDVEKLQTFLDKHDWFMTSGTGVAGQKWVALSHEALRASAEAVNQHLSVTAKDRWLNVLPKFHVGGFGVFERANLSGIAVDDLSMNSWDAKTLVSVATEKKSTLLSLVPTQVFDLVQQGLRAPPSLRAVVVGGGSLDFSLAKKADELGWPLRPSFGMTECGSQIATALTLNEEGWLKVLPHIELQTNSRGLLEIQSPALFSGYARWSGEKWNFEERGSSQWWTSEDLAELRGDFLRPLGRASRKVKVLGELVDLDRLTLIAQGLIEGGATAMVVAIPELRKQNDLVLVAENLSETALVETQRHYNLSVAPFERCDRILAIEKFNRTSLGKISIGALAQQLGAEKIS